MNIYYLYIHLSCAFLLYVTDKPDQASIEPSSNYLTHGTSFSLTCNSSYAKPDIQQYRWQKNGVNLTETNITLLFDSLNYADDDGDYTCSAVNLVGEGMTSPTEKIYVTCKRFQLLLMNNT